MAVEYNNPYQTGTDIDPNTIDAGNNVGEDEDVGALNTDYVDADGSDFIFLVGIGAGKDFRQTEINLNLDGLDSTKVKAVVNFINKVSRGTVLKVYKSYMRHKNAEQPDTLPLRAVDDQKVGFPFRVYSEGSGVPSNHTVWIPYVNQDMSKTALLAEMNTVKASLGYGHGGEADIREITMSKNLRFYPQN